MNNFKIYYLTTQTDNLIPKYIGQTKRTLEKRLVDHISSALYKQSGKRDRKNKWIRNRIQNGDEILIYLIEDGIETFEELNLKEILYITKYNDNDLVNGNKGGSYRVEYQTDEEIRKKISNSQKKRLSKPIIVLDKNQNFLYEFNSLIDCTTFLKMKADTVIGNLKNRTFCKSFIFIYKEEYNQNQDYSHKLFHNGLMIRNQSVETIKKRSESNFKKVTLNNICENWKISFPSIKKLCEYFNLTSSQLHSALIYKNTHKEKYKCFKVTYDKDIVRSSKKFETNKDND